MNNIALESIVGSLRRSLKVGAVTKAEVMNTMMSIRMIKGECWCAMMPEHTRSCMKARRLVDDLKLLDGEEIRETKISVDEWGEEYTGTGNFY